MLGALISAGIGLLTSRGGGDGDGGKGGAFVQPKTPPEILADIRAASPVPTVSGEAPTFRPSSPSQIQEDAREKYYALLAAAMNNAGGAGQVYSQLAAEMRQQNPGADQYAFGAVPARQASSPPVKV